MGIALVTIELSTCYLLQIVKHKNYIYGFLNNCCLKQRKLVL